MAIVEYKPVNQVEGLGDLVDELKSEYGAQIQPYLDNFQIRLETTPVATEMGFQKGADFSHIIDSVDVLYTLYVKQGRVHGYLFEGKTWRSETCGDLLDITIDDKTIRLVMDFKTIGFRNRREAPQK